MKIKKTIAAIAAILMASASLNAMPIAVYADTAGAAVQAANTARAVSPTVITPDDDAALDQMNPEEYAEITMSGDMFITYLAEGDTRGTTIPYGSYVKKGTEIYFCVSPEMFCGSEIVLTHNNSNTHTEPLVYNGGDAWIYTYVVSETDNTLSAKMTVDVSGVISPAAYSNLDPAIKQYYTKVNVQSPAYVLPDPVNGTPINSGDYILKNTCLWIAMYVQDYADNDFFIDGQIAEPVCVGGNYGLTFVISPDEDELNVTAQPTASAKSTIRLGECVEVSYYVDDWSSGANLNDGDAVRIGTPLLIGSYKNLIAGYDITVNGKVLPLSLNGDGTYMLSLYTPDSAETVIARVKRTELSRYEKENCVTINFGDKINVNEFPFSSGASGDEWHVIYDSGDLIAKGSTVIIAVDANDYPGNMLSINGKLYDMYINGDSTAYLLKYTIPDSAAPLNISLVKKQAGGSASSAASTTDDTASTAPAAGSSSASSAGTENNPSEKAVVKSLKKASKASISYDAAEAGITEDILKAFADNKRVKTITAKFDSFKVKIQKSDIENAEALEGIDLSVTGKSFITKSQIKKTKALKNGQKVVQIDFESKAEISGLKEITLQAKVGKTFKEGSAAVYELKGKKLVKVGDAAVDRNGYVSFDTDHLGQFVVVVK